MSRKNRKIRKASEAKVDKEVRTDIDTDTTDETGERDPLVERLYGNYSGWLITSILLLGCVAIYYRVLSFGFINFDDNVYVYTNHRVLGGLSLESLRWAFTTFEAANWHPVTWITHLTD